MPLATSKVHFHPIPTLSKRTFGININYAKPFGVLDKYLCGYLLLDHDHPCYGKHHSEINEMISSIFEQGFDYSSDSKENEEIGCHRIGFSTSRKELSHMTVTDVKNTLISVATYLDSI